MQTMQTMNDLLGGCRRRADSAQPGSDRRTERAPSDRPDVRPYGMMAQAPPTDGADGGQKRPPHGRTFRRPKSNYNESVRGDDPPEKG